MHIMEVLKSLSGEDTQRIEGKYRDAFFGRMQARFMLLDGDELLEVPDHAGALASRLMFLKMPVSFEGREDEHLLEKLIAEASCYCPVPCRHPQRAEATGPRYLSSPET